MLEQAFQSYLKRFKDILPVLVINLLFDIIIIKLCFSQLSTSQLIQFYKQNDEITNLLSRGELNKFLIGFAIFLIVQFFAIPLFSSIRSLIMKRIINDEKVDQIETIKESSKYYWSYMGVTVVVGLIIIGIVLGMVICALIPVIGILLAIGLLVFMIYIATTYLPCKEYLIYYDTSVGDALSEGKAVGKRYFWNIFFLSVVIEIISKILDVVDYNIVAIFMIILFIKSILGDLVMIYLMRLCKGYEDELNEQFTSNL